MGAPVVPAASFRSQTTRPVTLSKARKVPEVRPAAVPDRLAFGTWSREKTQKESRGDARGFPEVVHFGFSGGRRGRGRRETEVGSAGPGPDSPGTSGPHGSPSATNSAGCSESAIGTTMYCFP